MYAKDPLTVVAFVWGRREGGGKWSGKAGGAGHVEATGTVGGTGQPPTAATTTSASLHFVAFNCERVDCIQLVRVGISKGRGDGDGGKCGKTSVKWKTLAEYDKS